MSLNDRELICKPVKLRTPDSPCGVTGLESGEHHVANKRPGPTGPRPDRRRRRAADPEPHHLPADRDWSRVALAGAAGHRVALTAPLLGAAAVIGSLNASLADQGLGDVKLVVAVAWMAHLGLFAWVTGVLVGQLLMIGAVASTQVRRRRAGLPPSHPAGPQPGRRVRC